jgi:glyceraldehyde 3-phosphate dehydrogenase
MTVRVAINGAGRIGRSIIRAWREERLYQRKVQIVAINDLSKPEDLCHLLKYDSVHGRLDKDVSVSEDNLWIDEQKIKLLQVRSPAACPWDALNIDVVLECSGRFTDREQAEEHIEAGARRVLISAPGKNPDATVVYGVNHNTLKAKDRVISNASCTTNALAPLLKVLHADFGIEHGLMTTIHAYTNDQTLVDATHSDLCRARAAALSMIPTKTGAASAIGMIIPELAGKLDGYAMRVPTPNVSVVDLTVQLSKKVSLTTAKQALKHAAGKSEFAHILECTEEPLVSIDFNHHAASVVCDLNQVRVQGDLLKVLGWYDNEWAFANRMLDVAIFLKSL